MVAAADCFFLYPMKNSQPQSIYILVFLLSFSLTIQAQNKISIDVAEIRNIHHRLNGMNLSGFYHFNNHLSGGIEMNRFFAADKQIKEESVTISAWDFDCNFHYQLPITKSVDLYPLIGFSHTSEKEVNSNNEAGYERFWSYNTGAGLSFKTGRWIPHIEYLFTWGHINQQFLLAGMSYELEWGK